MRRTAAILCLTLMLLFSAAQWPLFVNAQIITPGGGGGSGAGPGGLDGQVQAKSGATFIGLVSSSGTLSVTMPAGSLDVTPNTIPYMSQYQTSSPLKCIANALGSGTAYVGVITPAIVSYSDGQQLFFTPDVVPTAPFTVDCGGGAKNVYAEDEVTRASTGAMFASKPTRLKYETSLNSGAGGFVLTTAGEDPFLQSASSKFEFDRASAMADWNLVGTGTVANSTVTGTNEPGTVGVWAVSTKSSTPASGDTASANQTGLPLPRLDAAGGTWSYADFRWRVKPDPTSAGTVTTWVALCNGTNLIQSGSGDSYLAIVQTTNVAFVACGSGALSTTNWNYIQNMSGVIACVDSGVAATANAWALLKIYSYAPGTFHMQVNNGADQTMTWSRTTGGNPSFGVVTHTTAQRSIYIDLFSYKMTGLARSL